MTIYAAGTLKERILSALAEEASGCVLNLSEVTEIDTVGLQILLMVERACAARRVAFKVAEPSEAVSELLGLLRLKLTGRNLGAAHG
jgi:anti-anti-sigma factor